MNWQFRNYVKSIGKDPDALNDLERKDLKSAMVTDLYPGTMAVDISAAEKK